MKRSVMAPECGMEGKGEGAARPGRDCGAPAWGSLYPARREIERRFGRHFSLPLARRAEDVVAAGIGPGSAVLDVGAGRRDMKDKLSARIDGLEYLSLDPDRTLPHDYRDFGEVNRAFDAVLMFEVLEHSDLAGIGGLLASARRALRPGGMLYVTTPSIYTPGRFGKDAAHRTPLAHDELGGIIGLSGFRVDGMWRIYNAPFVQRFLHVRAAGWLHRFLGVDYAFSVMASASAGEGG